MVLLHLNTCAHIPQASQCAAVSGSAGGSSRGLVLVPHPSPDPAMSDSINWATGQAEVTWGRRDSPWASSPVYSTGFAVPQVVGGSGSSYSVPGTAGHHPKCAQLEPNVSMSRSTSCHPFPPELG